MADGDKDYGTAVFGGGCFWCIDAVFSEMPGIIRTECGYAGGTMAEPTYEDVCSGTTGHAEVVRVTYDRKKVSYRDLIETFLSVHDPTTPDRQGPDYGSQYRSIILYQTEQEKEIAADVIAEVERKGIFGDPVVTEIVPLRAFYLAEEYHQKFFSRNPDKPYCRIVIAPKVSKFRKRQSRLLGSP
ncbi:MAG: peptide-methionine (S)-S-oxide reductase MsrA [Thermoplasmata archaeon]|uniref:Peptide methionine sulfoxide reductase MsrA n=1 Tax=Candidatus Sysuiplasma superficiale TaxID=2823368 RepID=A0A8J8CAQ4_9ARCH|nr:peptide-methionine (S)-S-oxide reductase MsrA [Candidatus Sysuiplasma superficiale]MBX8644490.1 peptide-methionine (S)-S-oxide reductase MsrA [Candidatus Sysuiplasma superficiale]